MGVLRSPFVLVLMALFIVVSPGEARALDEEVVRGMLVANADVPSGFARQPDGSLATWKVFTNHGGERAIRRTFAHADGEQQVVDERYVFPSAALAQTFLVDATTELSAGLPPLAFPTTSLGDDAKHFQGRKGSVVTSVSLFRVDNVVGRILARYRTFSGAPLPPQMVRERQLRVLPGVAYMHTKDALGASGPPPAPSPAPPPPPTASTIIMPIGGWRVTLPGVWRVAKVELTTGEVNMLSRGSTFHTEVEISVQARPGTTECTTSPSPNLTLSPFTIAGFDRGGRTTSGEVYTYGCARLRGVTLHVGVSSPNADAAKWAQTILAAARDHFGSAPPPEPYMPPPSRPLWTPPSPSPTYVAPDDGERFDDGFAQPHFVGLRLMASIGNLSPDDARESAFGLGAGVELGVVTHRLIGFAADMGMSLGYGFDGNVPADVHVGVGPGLGLGPVSLVPLIGVGVNTRGGGDPLLTHTMDAALYWYPGGRVRMRYDPVALDAYATVGFRGNIAADAAVDVTRIIRLLIRLGFRPDASSQDYFVGFQYEGLQGATTEDGTALYPDATQIGAVAGVGFSFDDLVN